MAFRRGGHSCLDDQHLSGSVFARRIASCKTVSQLAFLMGTDDFLEPDEEVPTLQPWDPEWCYHKMKMVNWWNLIRVDGGPQTIEFRQPQGSIEEGMVAMVVQLCIAIVRAAERRADAEEEGWLKAVEQRGTLEGLFEVLGLVRRRRSIGLGR
jgi:hypothetical protein